MKQIKVTLPEIDGVELKSAKVDLENKVVVCEYGEKWVPKDGDVVFTINYDAKWVAIFEGYCGDNEYRSYAMKRIDKEVYDAAIVYDDWHTTGNETRPATPEEAQILFNAMAEEGKRWNAEKKCVEDIPKPFDIRKGDVFRCIKDVIMNNMDAAYTQHQIYISEEDRCITDNSGVVYHVWDKRGATHFEKIGHIEL